MMPRDRILGLLGWLMLTLAPCAAPAQGADGARLTLSVDSRAWLSLGFGLEYPLLGEAVRARASLFLPVLAWAAGGQADTIDAGLGLAGSLLAPGFDGSGFGLEYRGELSAGAHSQALGDFLGIGTRLSLSPVWKAGSFAIGPSLEWDRVWLTRIALSPDARSAFEGLPGGAEPAEGWYLWGASVFNLGAFFRLETEGAGTWSLFGAARLPESTLVAPMEGFPFGEWPFFARLGWSGAL